MPAISWQLTRVGVFLRPLPRLIATAGVAVADDRVHDGLAGLLDRAREARPQLPPARRRLPAAQPTRVEMLGSPGCAQAETLAEFLPWRPSLKSARASRYIYILYIYI